MGAVLFGCTSTRTASVRDVQRLEPGLQRGVAIETTARWRSRLDPNTWVRLRDKQGRFSSAIRGRDLRIDGSGLFAPGLGDLASRLNAIRIEAMSPAARARIEPLGDVAVKELADGGLFFEGPPGEVYDWAVRFLERVSRPELAGTWRMRVGATWQAPVSGRSLVARLRRGAESTSHYPWGDIAEVELTDISGAKTLGSIVGHIALAAVLVPLAAVGSGVSALPGKPSSSSGSSGSGSGSSGSFTGGGWDTGSLSVGDGQVPDDGSWTGELEIAPAPQARALFSKSARRKSIARLTLAADWGADTLAGSGFIERLTLGVRLGDLVEIGGGVGHAWIPGASERHDVFGFVRFAFHLPLDAEHNYALPLGVDVGTYMPGGYLRVKHARLGLGLRRRIGDDLFVGAYLLNPTYLATNRSEKRWSFASGLELGAAF